MKQIDTKRLWKGFWQLADPKIWIASTVPMAVGAALTYGSTGGFNLYWFIVALIGVYCIEIGKNAINEFIDYGSGVDRYITADKRNPFSGGKKTIVDGKLTVLEAKIIASITMGAACIIGLYVVFYHEFSVLWVGLLGVFLTTFYSMPPFKFNYSGFGEFVVGFTFGPLVLSGIYLTLNHIIDYKVLLVSLPIGFLITNVLWINQFPDYEADKKGNKFNWVVRLGKKRSVPIYAFLFKAAFGLFIIISIVYRNPLWLLSLLAIPKALRSVKVAKTQYDNIPELMQANAGTVQIYMVVGICMVIAAVSNKFINI